MAMKASDVAASVCSATLVFLLSAGACAEEGRTDGVSEQELQAKLAYCKTCHGAMAQGFRGEAPMPRLAGQQPEYIDNQLQAFIDHRRTNPVMTNVAHTLSPAMLAALADRFNTLDPEPLGGAPKDLVPAGKKIFEEGVPGADVPACASCHGEAAKGNGKFPRLAGQLNDYIIYKLSNWDKERGQDLKNPDDSAIMQPIAHSLTPEQLAAVAAYVSSLR
jgi:cytochrome c553